MLKEIKDKWIAALKSGRYNQVKGSMRLENLNNFGYSYCCLGVLVEECYSGDDREWHLKAMQSVPLDLELSVDIQNTLSAKNDRGDTFNQIADWIEENVGTSDSPGM
jgi:hypothetical protein